MNKKFKIAMILIKKAQICPKAINLLKLLKLMLKASLKNFVLRIQYVYKENFPLFPYVQHLAYCAQFNGPLR